MIRLEVVWNETSEPAQEEFLRGVLERRAQHEAATASPSESPQRGVKSGSAKPDMSEAATPTDRWAVEAATRVEEASAASADFKGASKEHKVAIRGVVALD